jgi:hypothetical protein
MFTEEEVSLTWPQRLRTSIQTMRTLAEHSVQATLVMVCAEDTLVLDRSFKTYVAFFVVHTGKANQAELCLQPINFHLNGYESKSRPVQAGKLGILLARPS